MSRKSKDKNLPQLLVNATRFYHHDEATRLAKAAAKDEHVNLDDALYSLAEMKEVESESSKVVEKGGKFRFPYMYMVSIVQLAMTRAAEVLFALPTHGEGTAKNWPSRWGSAPSGTKIGPFRLFHSTAISKTVDDGALKQIGDHQYVVGYKPDGSEEYIPAAFCISPAERGNYGFNQLAMRRLGYQAEDGEVVLRTEKGEKVSKTDFATLVGQINNTARTETWEDKNKMSVCADNTVDWGWLVKDGKPLTAAQIHKLEDANGVKFQPKEERWIGRVKETDLVNKVISIMKRAKDEDGKSAWENWKGASEEAIVRNVNTQTRHDPCSLFTYGLRLAMAGMATSSSVDENGKTEYIIALGGRLVYDLATKKRRGRAKSEKTAIPKKEKTPKAAKPAKTDSAKAASAKKKAEKKAAKAAKPTSPKSTDAAKPKRKKSKATVETPALPSEPATAEPVIEDISEPTVEHVAAEEEFESALNEDN